VAQSYSRRVLRNWTKTSMLAIGDELLGLVTAME
jgi:hypothetical protein